MPTPRVLAKCHYKLVCEVLSVYFVLLPLFNGCSPSLQFLKIFLVLYLFHKYAFVHLFKLYYLITCSTELWINICLCLFKRACKAWITKHLKKWYFLKILVKPSIIREIFSPLWMTQSGILKEEVVRIEIQLSLLPTPSPYGPFVQLITKPFPLGTLPSLLSFRCIVNLAQVWKNRVLLLLVSSFSSFF